jgi:spermidine/putrescine transport system ATP-binding protein
MLRLIAGFERPDHGDILIDGRSVVDSPPNLRPVNPSSSSTRSFLT